MVDQNLSTAQLVGQNKDVTPRVKLNSSLITEDEAEGKTADPAPVIS